MARFKEGAVQALLKSHLKPGEELQHWAYGVKQPHILLLIIFLPLAAGLTKDYVVGLTDRRFIVLRVSSSLNVEQVLEYALSAMPPVKASTGPVFTHIRIDDPQKPFVAKFHRLGLPNNREHTKAMAEILKNQPPT